MVVTALRADAGFNGSLSDGIDSLLDLRVWLLRADSVSLDHPGGTEEFPE